MNDAEKRMAALWEYKIMDTPPEQAFDDLTQLTSFICGTPIALVTLLDLQRQWFKSSFGLSVSETPLEHAFCAHAIKQERVFLVPDATRDDRFSSNPLVTGEPNIRFYAGAPLITPDGVAVGTLCAIDRVPRQLSQEQQDALAALARQVIWALELRKTVKALSIALAEKKAARQEVATLQALLPMCAWCHKVRDDENFWHEVEDYLAAQPGTRVSHGVCPDCAAKFEEKVAGQDNLPNAAV
jgi:GAF domain-containing protein